MQSLEMQLKMLKQKKVESIRTYEAQNLKLANALLTQKPESESIKQIKKDNAAQFKLWVNKTEQEQSALGGVRFMGQDGL
jgi:uncharacterized protein YjaZ